MARKRISMKKIRKVLKLKFDSDLSIREIARALNISKSTVGEYLALFNSLKIPFTELMKLSDDELTIKFQTQREVSLKYKNFLNEIPSILKKINYNGMTKHLLWEHYIAKYPNGYKYSRFCFHLHALEQSTNLSMKQHHKPGDKMFVDYTGSKLSFIDPKTEQKITTEVYVAVLGAKWVNVCRSLFKPETRRFCKINREGI